MVSVKTAAQMTRTSKTTIQRHIKSGKLSAKRNDADEWMIDPAELARVMTIYESDCGEPLVQDDALATPHQPTEPHRTNGSEHPGTPNRNREIELLQEQIDLLQNERKREREQLQARIDELSAACQDWKTQASNQTLLLSNEQAHSQRGFWSRVFR